MVIPCIKVLSRELPPGGRVHGRFIFGMTSDAHGRLTDLCLISSDLGDTPRTLSCVAEAARAAQLIVVPDLREEPWKITWMLD
jgi:hypothetical protein